VNSTQLNQPIIKANANSPLFAKQRGAGGESDLPHGLLSRQVTIKEPGYAYIYLSNEGAVQQDIYFDDLTITHKKSPIVQGQEYYPFGLTFNSYQKESTLRNNWKFQGQEHEDGLDLNWDQFKWRNHQPDIGRFFNVDPLSEKYVHNSPYAFSENKVTAHVELEGLEAHPAVYELKREGQKWKKAVESFFEAVKDYMTDSSKPDRKYKSVNEEQNAPTATGPLDYGDNSEVLFNPNATPEASNSEEDSKVAEGGQKSGVGDRTNRADEVQVDNSSLEPTVEVGTVKPIWFQGTVGEEAGRGKESTTVEGDEVYRVWKYAPDSSVRLDRRDTVRNGKEQRKVNVGKNEQR
jgi:RHS repeat-associated protein